MISKETLDLISKECDVLLNEGPDNVDRLLGISPHSVVLDVSTIRSLVTELSQLQELTEVVLDKCENADCRKKATVSFAGQNFYNTQWCDEHAPKGSIELDFAGMVRLLEI